MFPQTDLFYDSCNSITLSVFNHGHSLYLGTSFPFPPFLSLTLLQTHGFYFIQWSIIHYCSHFGTWVLYQIWPMRGPFSWFLWTCPHFIFWAFPNSGIKMSHVILYLPSLVLKSAVPLRIPGYFPWGQVFRNQDLGREPLRLKLYFDHKIKRNIYRFLQIITYMAHLAMSFFPLCGKKKETLACFLDFSYLLEFN